MFAVKYVMKKVMINRLIKRGILYALMMGMVYILSAQDIAVYADVYGNLNVFNKGKIERIEFLEVKDLQLGGDYMVYIDNQNNFVHWSPENKQIVQRTPPSIIKATDNFLLTNMDAMLFVIEGQEKENVSFRPYNPHALGDNILAYIEYDDYLYVYDIGHEEIEIAPPTVSDFKVSDNSVAWIDPSDVFKIYHEGKSEEVDAYKPMLYSVGNNMTAYVDDYEEFKVYDKGEIIELESFPPDMFICGDDVLIYVIEEDELKIYYEGETTSFGDIDRSMLKGLSESNHVEDINAFLNFHRRDEFGGSTTSHQKSRLVDNTFYWLDRNNHLKYWSNGNHGTLTTYEPQRVKADTDIVAWMDIDGKLKAYYKGETLDISKQIIDDYYIHGNVIVYRQNKNEYKIFWNGKTY